MRNTTISSSIVSVVSRVIDSVAVAGNSVRSFLRLALMRERLGYWQEPCQPGIAFCGDHLGHQLGKPASGYKPDAKRQADIAAFAFYATPSRATSVRLTTRGY